MCHIHSCDFESVKTIVNTGSYHEIDSNSDDGERDGYFHKDSRNYRYKIVDITVVLIMTIGCQ